VAERPEAQVAERKSGSRRTVVISEPDLALAGWQRVIKFARSRRVTTPDRVA